MWNIRARQMTIFFMIFRIDESCLKIPQNNYWKKKNKNMKDKNIMNIAKVIHEDHHKRISHIIANSHKKLNELHAPKAQLCVFECFY